VLVIGADNGITMALSATTAPTFSIDAAHGSQLNLEDNDLIIHNGDYAAVQALATIGRDAPAQSVWGGAWDGNGLTSSIANSNDANQGYEQTALAVVLNGGLPLGQFSSWQAGNINEPLRSDGNDIIVKYTYVGDFTLSGAVDANAGTIFNTFYSSSSAGNTWAMGDANFDGSVDANDGTIFNTAYGEGDGGNNGPQL
jgi:hypothetical protein